MQLATHKTEHYQNKAMLNIMKDAWCINIVTT